MRHRPPTHSAASNAGTESSARVNTMPTHSPRVGTAIRCAVTRRRRPSPRRRGSRRSAPRAATARFRSGRRRPQPPAAGAAPTPAGRSARSVAARSSSPVRPAAAASDRARVAEAAGEAARIRRAARIHHRHVRSSTVGGSGMVDRDSASRLRIHHFDCAAVQFDRPPGDRQAQSGATLGGGAAGEPLEDPFPLGGRDTRALVAHLQSQTCRLGRARQHRNAAALRAVPNGVVHQVDDHLPQTCRVGDGDEPARHHFAPRPERHPARPRHARSRRAGTRRLRTC